MERYCIVVILSTLGMPNCTHQIWMTVPTLWILWSLSLQKSTLSLTSFSRYSKDFANLLFWVLWARLANSPILIVSTCKKVCLYALKKLTSCLFFFKIGIHSMQGWTATTRLGVTRKRSTTKIKAYRKPVYKEPTVKGCLLILDL